jgi:hypothetical protein
MTKVIKIDRFDDHWGESDLQWVREYCVQSGKFQEVSSWQNINTGNWHIYKVDSFWKLKPHIFSTLLHQSPR